jgi:hypothetical protein
MGFDYFKVPRSLFAVREGERRIPRSDPMKLLEGASEWTGPRRKSRKPPKIFVEVFLSGGPLSIWREFTLIVPVGLVKPFLMLIRGERVEVASMYRGGPKIPGLVQKRGSKTMEARVLSDAGRNLSFTFFVSAASVVVEGGEILMKFNRFFWSGKVNGA